MAAQRSWRGPITTRAPNGPANYVPYTAVFALGPTYSIPYTLSLSIYICTHHIPYYYPYVDVVVWALAPRRSDLWRYPAAATESLGCASARPSQNPRTDNNEGSCGYHHYILLHYFLHYISTLLSLLCYFVCYCRTRLRHYSLLCYYIAILPYYHVAIIFSIYKIFEVCGLKKHSRYEFWDQRPQILNTWTVWVHTAFPLALPGDSNAAVFLGLACFFVKDTKILAKKERQSRLQIVCTGASVCGLLQRKRCIRPLWVLAGGLLITRSTVLPS